MKRCPQFNRVETEDALVFCRIDGTRFISESGSVAEDTATVIEIIMLTWRARIESSEFTEFKRKTK